MVLIFSEKNDYSTIEVIDWLISRKVSFYRFNEDDQFEIKSNDGIHFFIKNEQNQEVFLNDVKSIWFRRLVLSLKKNFSNDKIGEFLNEETQVLNEYILYLMSKKKCLGSYTRMNVNKLIMLDIASKSGFLIPKTFILNSFENFNFKDSLITKPINENPYISINSDTFMSLLTTEIKNRDYKSFGNSLIQEKIEKKYEIRTFYLEGDTFSMAIFSQLNEKTKIDFRNYDKKKPNRTIPYILPNDVKNNLTVFMNKIGLNSGSVDIIVDNELNHYFLEVNPVGQFGMVSKPCNYNLENKIAEYLIYEN